MAGTATSRLSGSQRGVKNSYQSDRMACKFLCDLRTSDSGKDEMHPGIRYCTHVTQVAGAQPSYAYVGVPVNTWNYEQAPAVALMSSGPAGRTRLRTRARVKYVNESGASVDLLSGFIVKYDHSINEDSVVATVFDDRWSLSKVTVAGRATYDPETEKHYYDMSQPAIFNRDGWQDCLDSPYGPRFAPTRRYGYGATADSQGLSMEPSPGSAKCAARSWRCRDVAAYLRSMHTSSGQKPHNPMNYGNQNVTGYMIWPSSFGTDTYFDRVPRSLDLQNKTLLEALNILCRKAGPFDIWIKPNGFYGNLSLVRCDIRRGGTQLYLPRYMNLDIDQALQNSNVVQGGSLSESIINYFDDTCICGDPPAVERMFTTNKAGSPVVCPEALEQAWSTEDEAAFKACVVDNGNTKESFMMACDRFPLVYAAWRFKAAPKDPVWSSNSKWGNSANFNKPRFLSQLLSSFSGGNSTNPRDWQRMPITVEYHDTGYLDTWKACERFDGLEIAQDATYLWFPAIRAKMQSFERSGYDGATFVARDMRLTCVASAFFRMTGKNSSDPNFTSHRVEHNGARFTYMTVSEDEDYVDWEREDSHPIGNNVQEPYLSQDWPNQVGNGNELFTDDVRIDRHAKHRQMDVRRLEYSGNITLQRFNPGIKPGDAIAVEGGGIRPWGVVRAVTWDADTQIQTVEMMAADQSTIYDVPTGGNYAVPQPSQPPPSPAPTTSGGDSPDPAWNQKKYDEEMAKADSKYVKKDAQSTSSPSASPNAAPAPSPAAKGGSESDRELLGMMREYPGASKKAPAAAVSDKGGGKITTPDQPGWDRMKYEENQATVGIHTGEDTKQRDFDRVKKQRMSEGLTPSERRDQALAEAGERETGGGNGKTVADKARNNPGRWTGGGEEE